MLTIQRISQVPIHDGDRPVYLAEMAVFQMGQHMIPIVLIGKTDEQIAEIVAAKVKEISLATRNQVQNQGPIKAPTGPRPVPN